MPETDSIVLSVVVPAFNEAHRIGESLAELQTFLGARSWPWEVRLVDDGSRDETARIGDEFAKSDPRVVVQREPHRGKGGAVKSGMLAARGAYRFMCDADLSMPVKQIEQFLPPLVSPCDIAIGVREGATARRIGEPSHRHVMGRLFNHATQCLALRGIEDSQCGFKMFTATAANAVFPRVTVDGWAFDIEVLVAARRLGLRIAEVPIEWHFREQSQVSMVRDGFSMLADLWAIRGRARRGAYDRSPGEP